MLLTVASDDVISFKNNNKWLVNHPVDALIFKELETVWDKLKITYTTDFKNLVYGDLPNENLVQNTLKMIKDRLTTVIWEIEV